MSLHPTTDRRASSDSGIEGDILRVSIGAGTLHVARYGHGGAPVVLVHGFGTSGFLWREIGPALAESKLTAYAVDLLGYGESDRPVDGDYSIAAQAEHIDAALTSLRLTRATIVGIDVGGGVAMRLAATRPERVERLVLINSVAFDACPGRDVRLLNRNTGRFFFRVSQGVLGASPLLRPVLEGGVSNPENMPEGLFARYLAPYAGRDGVEHLLLLARSIHADDLEDLELGEIHAPTLVIWGEEDRWLDPKLPDRIINAIPGAQLVSIPGVSRLVPEEIPERLANLIVDFLRGR